MMSILNLIGQFWSEQTRAELNTELVAELRNLHREWSERNFTEIQIFKFFYNVLRIL